MPKVLWKTFKEKSVYYVAVYDNPENLFPPLHIQHFKIYYLLPDFRWIHTKHA